VGTCTYTLRTICLGYIYRPIILERSYIYRTTPYISVHGSYTRPPGLPSPSPPDAPYTLVGAVCRYLGMRRLLRVGGQHDFSDSALVPSSESSSSMKLQVQSVTYGLFFTYVGLV
jgi:hypothetical protein